MEIGIDDLRELGRGHRGDRAGGTDARRIDGEIEPAMPANHGIHRRVYGLLRADVTRDPVRALTELARGCCEHVLATARQRDTPAIRDDRAGAAEADAGATAGDRTRPFAPTDP